MTWDNVNEAIDMHRMGLLPYRAAAWALLVFREQAGAELGADDLHRTVGGSKATAYRTLAELRIYRQSPKSRLADIETGRYQESPKSRPACASNLTQDDNEVKGRPIESRRNQESPKSRVAEVETHNRERDLIALSLAHAREAEPEPFIPPTDGTLKPADEWTKLGEKVLGLTRDAWAQEQAEAFGRDGTYRPEWILEAAHKAAVKKVRAGGAWNYMRPILEQLKAEASIAPSPTLPLQPRASPNGEVNGEYRTGLEKRLGRQKGEWLADDDTSNATGS
jgi:hypothetical protein